MQLIQASLCHVLRIIILLYILVGIKAVCVDWSLRGSDEACCRRCSPGHRVVTRCGTDRTKFCTPCENDTYTNQPLADICMKCTQCVDPLVQLKPCIASADTVCGCKPGYRCGAFPCRHCVTECKKGEEPTEKWTCSKCPEGTFNDEIHSKCKPWRKSCPDGEHITARGNEFSDIECSKLPETTPSAPKETTTLKTTKRPKIDDDFYKSKLYLLIGSFGISAALTMAIILSLWLTYKRTKNKTKSKDQCPDTPTQGELTFMMVDHEEVCSFHQPEQEQGGSSESINTQDSETKLIV